MSRFRVEILPEAEAEYREAFLWYFERSPLAADAFRAEVFDKIDSLVDDADTWPKDESGIHFRIPCTTGSRAALRRFSQWRTSAESLVIGARGSSTASPNFEA